MKFPVSRMLHLSHVLIIGTFSFSHLKVIMISELRPSNFYKEQVRQQARVLVDTEQQAILLHLGFIMKNEGIDRKNRICRAVFLSMF
jgi:hypothetical protein